MKVLLLSDYAPSWEEAPPSRLLHLGREIARDGHEVRVVGPRGSTQPPEVAGVEVVSLPCRADGGLRQAFFPFRKDVLRHVRWCDALIVRGYWIGLGAFAYARVAGGKRRLYDYHGMNAAQQWAQGRRLRSVSTWFVEQSNLALATDILVISRAMMARLARRHARKAVFLENGVDEGFFEAGEASPDAAQTWRRRWGIPAGRPVFAMIAHFGEWFEPEVVVEAAARLKDRIALLVVGDGKGLKAARDEQQRRGLLNLHFAGILPHAEVRAILTHVAAACICPYRASWPGAKVPGHFAARKVKEYAAAGRPVLCSDVAGREAFLKDGETCLLYRAGDSADLARCMKDVIDQPGLAQRLGLGARDAVRSLSWHALYRASRLPALLQSLP